MFWNNTPLTPLKRGTGLTPLNGGANKKYIIVFLALVFAVSGIFGILGSPLKNSDQKTASYETDFERGGEQGSRTLSAIKRIIWLSADDASEALYSPFRHENNYSTEIKNFQNKNISNNEDAFVDPFLRNRVPSADNQYKYSTPKKIVKGDNILDNFKNLAREIFGAREALAQATMTTFDPTLNATANTLTATTQKKAVDDKLNNEKTWWAKKWDEIKSANYDAAFKSLFQNFSRQFASQVANRMTKGGPGGEGFGWDVPYDDYLRNSMLTAAGDFIGSLSQVWGIDLCSPPLLNGKLEITMALINEVVRPPKPRCEWTDIQKNWMKMGEVEYLDKFSASFDPKVNYLGSSFALREKLHTVADAAENAAMLKRGLSTDVGFKDYTDIGGYIKTPATFIAKTAESPYWEDLLGRTAGAIGSYTMGNILAPALDTFITTVAGNLIERWTTKGMFDVSVKDLALDWFKDPSSAGTTPSVGAGIGKTAADFEKGFTRPKFEAGGNRDILSELSTCPFPESPGQTSCVIDSNFAVAVRTKLSVGDAIKQNYINGAAVFGFASQDTEPKYNEGYPLRSMKILRRYRIIPVGWEIAAEYINMPSGASEYTQYSLKDMVDCYSPDDEWGGANSEDWCKGLVDPDWILKAPANSCEQKAYGQEIVSEYFLQQSGDNPSKRVVSRNQFCAVDKSCVLEADNGKCLKWGYCTEEKKIWRFKGDACDEQFNTCLELTKTSPQPSPQRGGSGSPSSEEGAGGGFSNVAYLKNTLDYGVCDASNAGCKWYCADGEWNNGAVAWKCGVEKHTPDPSQEGNYLPTGNALFFDKDAEICDEKNEGCHKFLRLENGANIIYNGGFENGSELALASPNDKINGWPVKKAGAAFAVERMTDFNYVKQGNYSFKITTDGIDSGIFSYDASDSVKMAQSMMPEGYSFDFSKSYILSADIKVEKGNAKIGIKNAGGTEKREAQNTKTGEWERLYVYLAKETFLPENIYIYSSADDTVFYVDNVDLHETHETESETHETGFTEYGNDVVYIKKAPDYLATKCVPPRFTVETGLKPVSTTRPAECKNYAAECKEEEAGCAKYTPTNGDPWIPAILSEGDKCDPECVNYKSYKQSATNFSYEILNVNFIADNPYTTPPQPSPQRGGSGSPSFEEGVGGRFCPAQEIGCTEFTNLDKLAKGGEAREYYSELKQCITTDADGKPITSPQPSPAGEGEILCGTFYTWSGSDTAGYELNTYYLQKDNAGAPVEISNPQDLGECNGPEDLATNYNCREFYNDAGQKSYAIYRNTVKCSENCKPYRRTKDTINESACALYGSEWVAAGATVNAPSGASVSVSEAVCKMEVENCLNSGGNWTNNECIYKAIPGEGITCSSKNAGCNEYQGTTSGNVKTVLESYFEDGSNDGWTDGKPSSEAVIVGAQSLTVNGSATSVVKEDINGSLKSGNNYVISFLAYNKTAAAKTIKVVFKGSDFYAVRNISLPLSEWKDYKTSVFLSGDLDKNGKIDASDLAILGRAIANPMSVTSEQRELADIDGNGKIDNNDNVILSSAKDLALTSDFIEISGMSANIYLDNIVIKEIQGNIYRIKDSWTVPAVCDSPKIGAQLRCAEYTDNYNNLLQIDNFSKFCSSEAVGCEKMVDTANSESVFRKKFNLTDLCADGTPQSPSGDCGEAVSPTQSPRGTAAITIPRDKIVYLVNDSSKYCYGGADDPGKFKGCQKFGVPQFNQEKTGLATGSEYAGDVYIINDPDSYNNIICKGEALECAEYKYNLGGNQGSLYFKDPGDKTCEFNNGKWVKITSPQPSPQRGGSGSPSSEEGAGGRLCPVVTNINLTIGNSQVEVPADKWAGICPAAQSGCTEYIDPLSDNEPNEVMNGGFEQDIQGLGEDTKADGPDDWLNVTGCMGTPAHGNTKCMDADCCFAGYSKTKAIEKGTQRISTFQKDTLYTLSAREQGDGTISISGCSVESPDNSMIISEAGDRATLSFSNAGMRLTSGRFYLKSTNEGCLLSVNTNNGFVDEVNIQKSGLYYYNSGSLDKGLCQNKVNTSEGCILVNEREYTPPSAGSGQALTLLQGGNSHKPLTYSADIAYGDTKGANFSCVAGTAGCSLSANEVIKVEPDRVCGKWLQEGNTEIGESGEILVRDVDACVSAKSDGSCKRMVTESMANMNFKTGNVSLMRNISGLSKAGFEWEDKDKNINKIDGYYPISSMSEIGQYIEFPGGFEDGLAGWEAVGASTDFAVIDNPVSAQAEDLDPRAPVGKGFAKLSGSTVGKLSEPLPVTGGLEYILSGYINSRNINTNATSSITATIFNGDTKLDEKRLEIRQGIKKWNYLTNKFMMPSLASKIVVTIENRPSVAGSGISGDSYFDEISIHPALSMYSPSPKTVLSSSESLNQSGMAPSLCKVYPEENSLSCEYKGDNNIRYLGSKGYCLEYDRAPGDPSVCISWYPIDIIRGEEGRDVPPITFAGFDEGPLYYCLEGQFLESREVSYIRHMDSHLAICPVGYCRIREKFNGGKETYYFCEPNEPAVVGQFWPKWGCGVNIGDGNQEICKVEPELFYYTGELSALNSADARAACVPHNTREDFMARCTKIVQVATVDGNSQVWAERLNPASNYSVKDLIETINGTKKEYSYLSSSPIYGALPKPYLGQMDDVSTWDADGIAKGKQPLDIEINWETSPIDSSKSEYIWQSTDTTKHITTGMGLPYSCSNLNYDQCNSPIGNYYYKDSAGNDQLASRSISVGVKNDLVSAQGKLKNLFTKSYNAWEWQDGIGYEPVNEFNYLQLIEASKTNTVDCSKDTAISSYHSTQVLTWLTDDAGAETCFIPWRWDVPVDFFGNPQPKLAKYIIDSSFSDESLKDSKCDKETLASTVEDILDKVLPKTETYTEIQKAEDGFCYNNTITYTEELVDIIEEKIASGTVGVEIITASPELNIIAKTIKKGSDYYKYTITYDRTKTTHIGAKVACINPMIKKVREGDECYNYQYEESTITSTWNPPVNACATPAHKEDEIYCAVPPKVTNVKINGRSGENVKIGTANDIVLSYNSIIDPNQEPLTGYFIDWGDGVEYSVEGKRKKSQPIVENPHKYGHRYYYNDTVKAFVKSENTINDNGCLSNVGSQLCCFTNSNQCPENSDCCFVRPSIRIKDNWGWCNNGVVPGDPSLLKDEDNRCPPNKSGWATYDNWIIVTKE